MRWLRLVFAVGFLGALGCGGASAPQGRMLAGLDAETDASRKADDRAAQAGANAQAINGPNAPNQRDQAGQDAALPRKIIYNAQVVLTVESFEQAEPQLTQLIKDVKGYVAKSEIRGSPGSPRIGTWTVRVPVAKYEDFMDAAAKLGELQRKQIDSDDITDRYFDLQARLKNRQQQEERLREHLKKSTGNLKEILEVEEQLNRVRGEIEVQQGQLQRWDKLVDLATVVLTIYERKDYVPATSPNFSTSIGRTFTGSVQMLLEFGKGIVLVIVALVPWIPVVALVGVTVWLFIRRLARTISPSPQPLAVATATSSGTGTADSASTHPPSESP